MQVPENTFHAETGSKSPLTYLFSDPNFLSEASKAFLETAPTSSDLPSVLPPKDLPETLDNSIDISVMQDSLMGEGDFEDLPSVDGHRKSRRRKRQPKNCSFCRRRKLKCDREHPCSNCVKRKIETSCTYIIDDSTGSNNPSNTAESRLASDSSSITPSDLGTVSSSNTLPHPRSFSQSSSTPSTGFELPPKDLQQPRLISRKAQSPNKTVKFSDFAALQDIPQDAAQATTLKKRLDKMEMLVLSMLQERTSAGSGSSTNTSPESSDEKCSPLDDGSKPASVTTTAAQDLSKTRDSLGMLKLDENGKSIYHGDTHWGSLFSEIEQLEDLICKLTIEQKSELHKFTTPHDEGEHDTPPFPFMSSGGSKLSPIEVLSTIPSRAVCDMLIERYFVFSEPCFKLINRPWFEREYKEFWANPTNTELIWVSMFLGMLVLALQSYPSAELPEMFRGNPKKAWLVWMEGSEVCAFKGKLVLKPGLNNVRSTILWILTQARFHVKFEWTDGISVALSMTVRMCQSMGLHRDPKWFSMSSYEAEQRRRIWAVVQFLDLHASMIQGLPNLITITGSDVEPPTNTNDEDVMPEYEHQPQSLPLTTRTTTSFTIFRVHSMRWLARVLHDSSSIGPYAFKASYEQVLETHHKIRTVYNETPEFLSRSVLTGDNTSCPNDLLMQRLWYEVDYLRALHALHRYYGALGMENVKFRRSREESLSASVRLLKLAEWCYRSPEGIEMRRVFDWSCHYFLLPHFLHATVYSCLALMDHFDTFPVDQRVEQKRLVDLSLLIFQESTAFSDRFQSITIMLTIMVAKVHEISLMSVKERANVLTQRELRKQTGYGYNNTFNIPHHSMSKGMTMNLDTTDSNVKFNKFVDMSGITPSMMSGFGSPATPSAWFSIAEDFKTTDAGDIGLGNNIDFSQIDSFYPMQDY